MKFSERNKREREREIERERERDEKIGDGDRVLVLHHSSLVASRTVAI